ncbi:uncharacterized protein LY89DRAFT_78972 [Mollisia scopiformis]|uniref:Uncharacterized protein n=1 Tax=Mollisia scopiformis TaxID=149040 RepID=A0A194X7Z1_MOLSC|nr:uncharacterized protein LY89DRAFT_78972 [Mollisia scopiformis]KUJ16283.1 hypothetical protein LY89DRAFT_78972 [Mollisia scopiformis]
MVLKAASHLTRRLLSSRYFCTCLFCSDCCLFSWGLSCSSFRKAKICSCWLRTGDSRDIMLVEKC